MRTTIELCRGPVISILLFAGTLAAVEAQTSEDLQAIRAVALDYGEGWYEGDAERMARALHPELAKRMVYTDPGSNTSRLSQQGAMTLVRNTERGGGVDAPVEERSSTVTVLDVFENAAAVKVEGPEWVDYLQMARWNGHWVIVNVLWELNAETRRRRRGGS